MKRKKYFLDIGQGIKITRIKKRLNQKELAEKIGKSASFLSQIENGNRDPNIETLEKIAEELKTTPNKILEEAKIVKTSSEFSKIITELLQQIDVEDLIKEIINQIGIEKFKKTVEKTLSNSNEK